MRYWTLALIPALGLTLAGCGHHPTTKGSSHHPHHHHQAHSSTPPSISPSSNSPASNESPSSPPSPVLTTAPPAGGVATANQIQAMVNSVAPKGTVQVNGQPYNVFLINVSLRNPTPAMILFSLNDLIVGPKGNMPQSSLNDYDLTGITPKNSLFPYPIVPAHSGAVVVRVASGTSVSGNFTVEAPPASVYSVSIANGTGTIATFSN